MDEVSKKMMSIRCRLCAAEKPLLIRMFDETVIDRNIPTKIQINLGITVLEDDNLPHNICYLCLEKLETFNAFVESCQLSQIQLNEMYSKYGNIANINMKSHAPEDIVEVVYLNSDISESNDTIASPPYLKTVKSQIEIDSNEKDILEESEPIINSENDCESRVMMNKSDKYWKGLPEDQEDVTNESRNEDILKNVTNAVLNSTIKEEFTREEAVENDQTLDSKFACPYCQNTFSRKGNLQQHLSIHTGVKPFKCDQCPLTFLRRQHLTRHSRIHSGEKPFSCDMCGASFTRKTSVRKHIENHLATTKVSSEPSTKPLQYTEIPADDVGGKQYVCNLCGASFARRNYVLQHAIVHATVRPYVCSVCSYSFARPQHLSRHMMIHMNIRPYKCDICNSTFRRGSYLKLHKKIHERNSGNANEQNESSKMSESVQCTCEICGNSFSDIKYLRQHYKTHSTEKPFQCHDCGSAFRRKHHLRRHVLIHTGEKPFTCEICGASFARKFYLKVHFLTHSNEKPHVCNICGSAFARNPSLRQHMKRHMFV